MFKVGDKVRILSGYYGDYNGMTAIVTRWIDNRGMVASDLSLREHSSDDEGNFHLCFVSNDLELVEEEFVELGWKVDYSEPHGWYIFDKDSKKYLHKDLKVKPLCGRENFHKSKAEAQALLDKHLGKFSVAEMFDKLVGDKTMQVPFTITGNLISVFIDGKSHFVDNATKNFYDLKEHLKGQHDLETIRNLVDKKAFVNKVTEGFVTVDDNGVYYKGELVNNTLTNRLLNLLDEGFDVRPWARFMDNLMQNPSYKSREALFNFLDKWAAPITEDGHFLAFKNVRADFKDIHSGTMDNTPGTIVSMPRDQVDDDSNRTCSAGLHAAATSYLSHFYVDGARTVVVKINPRDVVSVPADYNHAKMRTCQYEVLREVSPQEIDFIEQQNAVNTASQDWYVEYIVEIEPEGDTYYDSYYDSYTDN